MITWSDTLTTMRSYNLTSITPMTALIIIIIAFWLYFWLIRDCLRRMMNPFIWIVITIMMPGFGLILYLLFRNPVYVAKTNPNTIGNNNETLNMEPSVIAYTTSTHLNNGQTTIIQTKPTIYPVTYNTNQKTIESASNDYTTCTNCNELIAKSAKHCVYCGRKQEIQTEIKTKLNSISVKFCSNCGTQIDRDAAFCGVCGSTL